MFVKRKKKTLNHYILLKWIYNHGELIRTISKSFEREKLIIRDHWSLYKTGDTRKAFCLVWTWTCLLFPYVYMWADVEKKYRVASCWLRNVRKCEKKIASKENWKRSQEWNAQGNVEIRIHSTGFCSHRLRENNFVFFSYRLNIIELYSYWTPHLQYGCSAVDVHSLFSLRFQKRLNYRSQ